MPLLPVEQGQLHYDVVDITPPWVEKPETIILHHGIGATSDVWACWLPALVDRYRIVRFDMRGLGRSPAPDAGYHWSLDSLADDVFAVAAATETERFHLLGESIGGTIALRCAIKQGRSLLTLGVSNGAHFGASIQNVQTWRQIIDDVGMDGWSKHMMPFRFFDDQLSGEMRRWYEHTQADNEGDAVLSALGVLVGTDLSPDLGALDLPVLLMHPDSSPFIPTSVMADLHAILPDSELQIFAHARHGLPFSHAGECATVYRRFLERRAATRR